MLFCNLDKNKFKFCFKSLTKVLFDRFDPCVNIEIFLSRVVVATIATIHKFLLSPRKSLQAIASYPNYPRLRNTYVYYDIQFETRLMELSS